MPVFAIEGVIGAGKTSYLDVLQNCTDFATSHVIVYEPVDEWLNLKLEGPNEPSIFEKFYIDKKKYGFIFQMYALQTRVKKIKDVVSKNPNAIILCERSHLSDCAIFAELLKEMEILTKEEFHVYKLWYDMCVDDLFTQFTGIVYIDTAPSVCIERIMQRARTGEDSISLDYIKRLCSLHQSFIDNSVLPVCKVDGNKVKGTETYDFNVQTIIKFCNQFI